MATMAEISTGVGDGAEWIRDAEAAAAAAAAAAVEGERAREELRQRDGAICGDAAAVATARIVDAAAVEGSDRERRRECAF